jgi:hypothetical protein
MKPVMRRGKTDDPRLIVREAPRAFDKGKRVRIPGKLSVA